MALPFAPHTVHVALVLGAALGLVAAASHDAPAEPAVRYDRDVRPILSDRCFKCHGPDEAARQADLRLDHFEGATAERREGPALVPGDPGASELWRRVGSHDDAVRMPPPTSNKRPLTVDELEVVRRWIEAGAVYEEHWSFVAPTQPEPPVVRAGASATNEIDRFVLAELERHGLAPSEEADPATLLRRVFLDLTGLPPTLAELDRYLADPRRDRYERWVETLLHQEPYVSRYAERMAVPWLDAARYADTSGIHMDAGRSIWPWRDWVLRAFRGGKPFDEFIVEQLAGDLLPDATDEERVASGFNRSHVTTDEGGAIDAEYLVEYAVDRTATTGSVFLALTLGCARCHEHKFDPISHEEFYGFLAFFNSNEEPGLYSQSPDAKRALEPFLEVPTDEQRAERERLRAEIEAETARLDQPEPDEEAQRLAFLDELESSAGLRWVASRLTQAESTEGATLTVLDDGSALASGVNPDRDEHVLTLRTEASGLRLLLLEALIDASLGQGRVGRAENGNAVLTGVEAEARSIADPSRTQALHFEWAWADHEQSNGNFGVVNVLDPADADGWAVAGHQKEGPRAALLVADEPFGFEGGTELVVHLRYRSIYARHTLGRVRARLATLDGAALARLPAATSGWYHCGPFASAREKVFDEAFGPERESTFARARTFGGQGWRFDENLLDGKLNALADGVNAHYLAKQVFAPTARTLEIALGSDDGLRLYLDGAEVFANRIERGLAADQDRTSIEVPRGRHQIVFKVVNTGGNAGFYWSQARRENELGHDLVAALLPEDARWEELEGRLRRDWRMTYSPGYRARMEHLAALGEQVQALEAAIPRTMVMKERDMPRATYLLERGQYDAPDESRPTPRAIPAALGRLPEGAPSNRLGLAQWLVSDENPLVARVVVNRVWEWIFGTGIVRTSEDFGMQGEWPSHPELLDWLAVDFREHGWDFKRLVHQIVTSSTYRQSSRTRPEVAEIDPDGRLLASFPRRRLPAEFVRDQALHVAGLLVERFGGPSVKPYQPDGLWQEVAMVQSNTRVYQRGAGDDLWRRSLYTYWKRACPPPAMLTLDAPTREFCTIRRTITNTPLQALVLWNDEQFVEAARVFAQQSLAAGGDDDERLVAMHRACTARVPNEDELALLRATLAAFRQRFAAAPDDARALVDVGEAPRDAGLAPAELAAWTMIATSLFNLDATICRS